MPRSEAYFVSTPDHGSVIYLGLLVLAISIPRLPSWSCHKDHPLRGYWPTGPPHSTMRQNFVLCNVSFQIWRNRTQRGGVVQCGHMIQKYCLNKEDVGWLHSSCFFLGLVHRFAMFCHTQWKVSRVPVAGQIVCSIAGWNEDFAAELWAVYRCKHQRGGAERGCAVAVEGYGSKGFTNDTCLIRSHQRQWKTLCSGGDMCQERFKFHRTKALQNPLCRQQSRSCWMTWKACRLRKTRRLLEMTRAKLYGTNRSKSKSLKLLAPESILW